MSELCIKKFSKQNTDVKQQFHNCISVYKQTLCFYYSLDIQQVVVDVMMKKAMGLNQVCRWRFQIDLKFHLQQDILAVINQVKMLASGIFGIVIPKQIFKLPWDNIQWQIIKQEKVGKWDMWYRYYDESQFKLIVGAQYNGDRIKDGYRVEKTNGFQWSSKIVDNGEYKEGIMVEEQSQQFRDWNKIEEGFIKITEMISDN
ncbi:unnamed protein product [Paramecium pentaurelia]|uniref:Uncharacterized protein n=1 Tax=Paramecium pentaurelia TaxID=43138 RepID=A0A8S1T3A8_9CILI|nr:unnamed protein product [Paramecium pentaurelia]